MGFKEMTPYAQLEGKEGVVFEIDETLSIPGETDWIIIPRGIDETEVGLNPTLSGNGRIEYTLSNVSDVIANSNIIAESWSKGNVISYADTIFGKITAVRMVNISGTTQMIGGSR